MSEATTKGITPAERRVAIALCFLSAVFEGYDVQVIGVVGPTLAAEFDLRSSALGWIFGSTMVGLMVGALSGGWLADRIGRRPSLALGVFVFALATLATVLSRDATSFSIARGLTGLGIGAAMPNMISIAADVSPPGERSSTGMMMFCGLPTGAALAALIAAVLPDASWQTFFYIGGLPPLLLAVVILWMLPETAPTIKQDVDAAKTPPLQALFGHGRALMTINLWIAYAFTLALLYLMLNWLSTLVVERGYERSDAAGALVAFNAASIGGALILGRVVDRFGLRWPLGLVFLALLGAFGGLAVSTSLTQITVFSGLCGICIVGSQFILYGVAPHFYPIESRGIGAGAAVGIGRLGAIVGPVSAGFILELGGGADVMLFFAPVIVAAGIACVALSFYPRTAQPA